MLDEATAAAEAMTLARRSVKCRSDKIVVAGDCHPQTIQVMQTRAGPLGLKIVLANSAEEWDRLLDGGDYFAVLTQVPATSGAIHDHRGDAARIHAHDAAFIVAADLLALTLITPPAEIGADIALGTTQRFGVPMGCGGPHAAYLACREAFKRSLPGRRRIAWHCKRASSTSGARRPRPTSAPRRCCWPSSPACTRSITGLRG
jgi:glycine dehydrogenase